MTFALTAIGFLKRVRWQAWLVAGAALALWWAYHSGYSKRDMQADAEMAAVVASVESAQAKAGEAQLAVNAAAQARYQQLAERTDNEHERNLEAARAGARHYVAANRLRPAPDHSAPGATVASADSDGAGISERLPADPLVAVTDADMQACSIATAYAVDAHNWAAGLGE